MTFYPVRYVLLIVEHCRYFEDDDEEAVPALAYIPAPGSPTMLEMEQKQQEEEEEDDPLDAYMAGIEKEVRDTLYFVNVGNTGNFRCMRVSKVQVLNLLASETT